MGDFNCGHIQWKSLESTGGEDQEFLLFIQDSYLIPCPLAIWALAVDGNLVQSCLVKSTHVHITAYCKIKLLDSALAKFMILFIQNIIVAGVMHFAIRCPDFAVLCI